MNNSAKLARNFEETGISSAPHASCETRNQIVAAGFNAALAVDDNVWREGLYRSADSPRTYRPVLRCMCQLEHNDARSHTYGLLSLYEGR